jgi:glycerophosphoryl diester phosphodiesterase
VGAGDPGGRRRGRGWRSFEQADIREAAREREGSAGDDAGTAVFDRIANIAHRGASGTRPENTRAAFRRAMEIGADYLELDVRATSDGVAVVLHDASVDRTTDGSGQVSDMTMAQLRSLDAGSWFSPEYAEERVPTLAEAIGLTGDRVPLSLEIKAAGVEEQAVAAIRESRNRESFISSFSEDCLRRVRELDPQLPLELLVGIDPLPADEIANLIRRAHRLGARLLAPSSGGITPELVAAAAAAGLALVCWTVDDRDDMKRMLDLGVRAITTNYPEVLQELLGRPVGG